MLLPPYPVFLWSRLTVSSDIDFNLVKLFFFRWPNTNTWVYVSYIWVYIWVHMRIWVSQIYEHTSEYLRYMSIHLSIFVQICEYILSIYWEVRFFRFNNYIDETGFYPSRITGWRLHTRYVLLKETSICYTFLRFFCHWNVTSLECFWWGQSTSYDWSYYYSIETIMRPNYTIVTLTVKCRHQKEGVWVLVTAE